MLSHCLIMQLLLVVTFQCASPLLLRTVYIQYTGLREKGLKDTNPKGQLRHFLFSGIWLLCYVSRYTVIQCAAKPSATEMLFFCLHPLL